VRRGKKTIAKREEKDKKSLRQVKGNKIAISRGKHSWKVVSKGKPSEAPVLLIADQERMQTELEADKEIPQMNNLFELICMTY
jgi:hypothetical protein